MAQALGYGKAAVASVTSAADTALQSAVGALPALPNVAAEEEPAVAAAGSDGAGETATPTQSDQVPTASRHVDRAASKRAFTAARSDLAARGSADAPLYSNRPAKPTAKAAPAAANQPSVAPQVAGNPGAAAVIVDPPDPLSTTSIIANPDPPQPARPGKSLRVDPYAGRHKMPATVGIAKSLCPAANFISFRTA